MSAWLQKLLFAGVLAAGLGLFNSQIVIRNANDCDNNPKPAGCPGAGSTCTVTSNGTQSDTQTKVTAAAEGDTVCLPAGSFTWTSGVTVTSGKGLTIMGAGTPTSDPAVFGPSASCTQTQITLSGDLIGFTFTTSYGDATARVSCMSIIYGASAHAVGIAATGTCTSSGCPNLRWDNLTFPNWTGHLTNAPPVNSYGINAENGYFGLIDHNEVDGNGSNAYLELVEIGLTTYKGVGLYGDNDYAQPENYGGPDFLFFENNLLTGGVGFTETETNVVNYGGGRVVARYNDVPHGDYNAVLVWHGTESSGRKRSPHAFEYYNNSYSCDAGHQCTKVIGIRGGSGLAWGNTITGGTGTNMDSFFASVDYRTEGKPAANNWGTCDGSSVYDTNEGVTHFSGTISSFTVNGSGFVDTVTLDSSPSLNPTIANAIAAGAPYSLHDVTKNSGAEITGGSGSTVNVRVSGGPGAYAPSNGDTVQILRATVCLDQLGRTGGTLYSTDPAESTAANQTLSPAYIWTTTKTGGNAFIWGDAGGIQTNNAHLLINRDYYRETLNQAAQTTSSSPFSGASGMGHGTLALIPTTCTTGVAYWSTDTQGLYKCTATNTWRWIYSPYTYPHPMLGGLPANNYGTYFQLTENPIAEPNPGQTSVWTGGTAAGTTNCSGPTACWGDVQTNGAMVYGVHIGPTFGDPTGLLKGTWGATQGAQATVKITSAITVDSEVELRLRSTISANSNTGYEIYCSVNPSNDYCHIATWGGPYGCYDNFEPSTPSIHLVDGDILSATVSGTGTATTIKLYRNGVVQASVTDSGTHTPETAGACASGDSFSWGAWSSGNPGVGFWSSLDNGWTKFGLSKFSAKGQ